MPTSGTSEIQIDTTQIPDCIRFDLLSIIYDATAEYFQQPGVAEKFERWKEEKAKKAAETAARKGAKK